MFKFFAIFPFAYHFYQMYYSYIITTVMDGEKIITQIDISHYMIDEEAINLVIPGDLITLEEGFMNGHGTYRFQNGIYASLMGTVEITNKLIIVNPLKSKYTPQVGDIVVGRVLEISNKRWKIDINASAAAYLNLNAAYISEQRKKNQQDEFNMRKIMQEGDYVVAEVQSTNMDKSFNLHTRNPKYGKLQPGIFLEVPHKLIKKQKHHFLTINAPGQENSGTGIILGNNGNIWISGMNRNAKDTDKQASQKNLSIKNGEMISQGTMKNMSLLHNILKILSWEGLEISEPLLIDILSFLQKRGIQHSQISEKSLQLKEYLLDNIRERIPKRLEELTRNVVRN